MSNNEVVKTRPFIVAVIIDYVPNSDVHKSIKKKITGNVSVVSIDTWEPLPERTRPSDPFIRITDGKADFNIWNIEFIGCK